MRHAASARRERESIDRGPLLAVLGVSLDADLLELALTHRSYAYEHGGSPHNERLEFLGDSVLGLAITTALYRDNPTLSEGDLAQMRAAVVSTVALAEVATTIGLGQYILLGNGEVLTGGREKSSILADTMEALFGAVYLDKGQDAATATVMRLIGPLLHDTARFGAAMDPKTHLQEAANERGAPSPEYAVESTGPDHDRRFSATVTVGDLVAATGTGTSKKQAEMAAALTAWTELNARTS
ncbi:ribonuclease III [Microbacterium fandaimingii]|uniref:ribonuclease III n=1 Tax=Paramicrobacterium fandaimingii TaxID=2708079 RepID=UPI001423DDB9